jgi:transcription termination/antitermination protein NusA
MKLIALFEQVTHAGVKDCIETPNMFLFIVNPFELGKAVGKQGSNVKRLEFMLKKKVKVVEFSEERNQFLANLLMPVTEFSIVEEGKKLKIQTINHAARGLIIGRAASNLRFLEDVVRRFYDVEEIIVV